MADALSDQAWVDICAAAARTPDAETRAVLSRILFEEYPAFAYHRERVAAAYKRSERMLKHLDALAELYRRAWSPHLSADQLGVILSGRAEAFAADDKTTERDIWCISRLRRRPLATSLAARAIRRANRGRRSVQREWLYHRLCGVWLDCFHASGLTYSRPTRGGDPYGPLIAFMLAAIRQIMPEAELPDPEAMSDGIDRERVERENTRQFVLRLRRRIGV